MQWRKEHAVLMLTVIGLGLLARGRISRTALRGSRATGSSPELTRHPVPDLESCLPGSGTRGKFARDLFSPPRDTAPLPLLDLVVPPLETLEGLAPPSAFGPGPAAFGDFLRRPAGVEPVAGLFASEEEEADTVGIDFDEPDAGVDDASRDSEAALARAERLRALGYGSERDGSPARETLTSDERAERTAAYKKLYDWIYAGSLKFGHIHNADRYGLSQRPEEPIEFVEVDPSTGLARFGGQASIPYDRSRVSEFGFADTPANWIELEAFVRDMLLDDTATYASNFPTDDDVAEVPTDEESVVRQARSLAPLSYHTVVFSIPPFDPSIPEGEQAGVATVTATVTSGGRERRARVRRHPRRRI